MAFRNGIRPVEVSGSSNSSRTGVSPTRESNDDISPVSEDGNGSIEDDECRKKLLRERNRIHARLSRQRKRQRLEALQEENTTLQRDCKKAHEEILRLRGLLEECDNENSRLRAWVDGVMQTEPSLSNKNSSEKKNEMSAKPLQSPPDNYPHTY
mmetsp:Transcript_9381/g.14430  ORF Transcript_9381/g.14430 Transcript_9381/m.14430 type:complete len:154 (-) Transcript_9381:362-823(-)